MAGGTRSYEMARRLVQKGHEVNVITSRRGSDACTNEPITNVDGINVYWLTVPYSNKMSYGARVRAFLKFAIRSALLAKTLGADIIFATSTPLTIAIPGIYASWRHRVPMVFEVRDLWPEMPIAVGALKNPIVIAAARAMESWTYHHSAAVIALSPGMKQGVVSSGYSSHRVAVIPNSCDNHEFGYDGELGKRFRAKRAWLGDKPLMIYAGAFGHVNGLNYAVELAKALLAIGSDVRLLLVGDGSERESLIQKAREAGVYEYNLFVETQISKRDIPALFSASSISASLFVDVPEMRVNSSNKFFDSLAASRPVFINFGGWMHDLVTVYGCGIAAWERPLHEVAEELNQRLHDPEWLEKAAAAARHLAETYFDRDLLASQFEKVLVAAADGLAKSAESIAPGRYI